MQAAIDRVMQTYTMIVNLTPDKQLAGGTGEGHELFGGNARSFRLRSVRELA
jgi:hypothetical protein